jgi:hypothetical protein
MLAYMEFILYLCGMKDALTTPLHRGAKGGQQRMFY